MNRTHGLMAVVLTHLLVPAVSAAEVTTFGPDDWRINTVNGLTINGQLYDAEFVYEPFDIFLSQSAFDAALPNEPTFTTEAEATAAADALIQVLNDAALSPPSGAEVTGYFVVATGSALGTDPNGVDGAVGVRESTNPLTFTTPSTYLLDAGRFAGNFGNPAVVGFTVVPEPGTAALAAGGLLGLLMRRRRSEA